MHRLNERIGKKKVEDTLDDDLEELLNLKLTESNDEAPQKSTFTPSGLPKRAPVKLTGVNDVDFLDALLK